MAHGLNAPGAHCRHVAPGHTGNAPREDLFDSVASHVAWIRTLLIEQPPSMCRVARHVWVKLMQNLARKELLGIVE